MMDFKGLKRTSAVTDEPVTLAMVKNHLRVSGSSEDSLITGYLKGAREMAEIYCSRSFVPSTWKMTMNAFPDGEISLPMGPVTVLTNIMYIMTQGQAAVELTGMSIDLIGRMALVGPPVTGWPAAVDMPGSVTFTYGAGPADVFADNPARLTPALLMLTEHFYANRGAVVTGIITEEVPMGVKALLDSLKIGV